MLPMFQGRDQSAFQPLHHVHLLRGMVIVIIGRARAGTGVAGPTLVAAALPVTELPSPASASATASTSPVHLT